MDWTLSIRAIKSSSGVADGLRCCLLVVMLLSVSTSVAQAAAPVTYVQSMNRLSQTYLERRHATLAAVHDRSQAEAR